RLRPLLVAGRTATCSQSANHRCSARVRLPATELCRWPSDIGIVKDVQHEQTAAAHLWFKAAILLFPAALVFVLVFPRGRIAGAGFVSTLFHHMYSAPLRSVQTFLQATEH